MFSFASVIVTTYDRPDALARVLESLALQRRRDFEVVVADDGSGPETAACVEERRGRVPYALHHVWQEDRGFRAARVRNLAAAAVRGDYLVFIDGDCLVFPDYLDMHAWLSEPGWFARGTRVRMSRGLTHRVLAGDTWPTEWSGPRWAAAWLARDVDRIGARARVRVGLGRKRSRRAWPGVKSCNMAVWAEDFAAADGFDEAYEGYGHEDSDLAVRLIHGGVGRKEGRWAIPVLHLWHPEGGSGALPENVRRLEETMAEGRVRSRRGLSAHRAGASPEEGGSP